MLFMGLGQQQEAPLKPSDEFLIEVDFKFKQKTGSDHFTLDFTETRDEQAKKRSQGGPLPYLVLSCTVLKLQEKEVRIRAINNLGHMLVSKKAEVGMEFKMDLGYTADMKDRVTAYEITIYFLSSSRDELSRIHLFVMEDGTFLVNDEVRGKF
jgi:hypothetical protein